MNQIKECIYKGITYENIYGYFIDGQLIYELSHNEYYQPKAWHENKAMQLNYKYITK